MDSISFQNGFVCGIATKGLVKSGAVYEPVAYNDAGVYDFFYLDFKRVMEPFSIGMFTESVIVSGTSALSVSHVTQATDGSGNKIAGVYKVYCDISSQMKGINVSNKKSTRLHFFDGSTVPPFSTWFAVAGMENTLDAGYFYETEALSYTTVSASESSAITLPLPITAGGYADSAALSAPPVLTAAETVNIEVK